MKPLILLLALLVVGCSSPSDFGSFPFFDLVANEVPAAKADPKKAACDGGASFGLPFAINEAAISQSREKSGDAITRSIAEPAMKANNAWLCSCAPIEEIARRKLVCAPPKLAQIAP